MVSFPFRKGKLVTQVSTHLSSSRQARLVVLFSRKLRAMSKSSSEVVVKAVTSESSSGEISCSIDETNRVRALLGLKPLSLGPGKEEEAVNNFKKKREEEVAAAEALALNGRLEKAREKRMLHAVSAGATLGDTKEPGDEELVSAADWVRRSRTVEVTQKEKARLAAAAAAARQAEEDDEAQKQAQAYGNRDLAGLGIQHSAREFNEGEEVILTLADAPILETDSVSKLVKGLHYGEDALENVNIAAEERRRDALKRIQRSKRAAYSGYDDDEFEQNGGGGYAGAGAGVGAGGGPPQRKILSQYDDAPAVPTTRMVLGEGGQVSAAGGPVKQEAGGPVAASLRASVAKEAESFYSQTEYAAFNKPKGEKKLRKKRKIRDKGDEWDAAEDDGEGEGARALEASLLQSTSLVGGEGTGSRSGSNTVDDSDFGSRRKVAKAGDADTDDNDEAARRMQSYQNAVLAAGRKSELALSGAAGRGAGGRGRGPGAGGAGLTEEVELQASLQRAQRLSGRAVDASVEDSGAVWVRRHAVVKQEPMDIVPGAGAGDGFTLDSEGRKADGTLVFTSTTAFSSRMLASADERARDAENRLRTSGSDGAGAGRSRRVDVKEERMDVDGKGEGAEDSDKEDSEPVGKSSHYQSSEVLGIAPQPVASSSMAATLALLKGSGDLKAGMHLVGRSKDQRKQDPSSKDFKINLDYTDERGNKLTEKEAFRQINYAFHGIAPGIKAQEKRLRQLEREQAQRTSKEGATGAMKNLLDAQKATGSAHVVVSGPSKTGHQQDDSVARLALDMHAKRVAYKEKQAAKAAAGDGAAPQKKEEEEKR